MAEEARKTATKMGGPTGKKWERFERVVAALHFAEIKGGAVKLNEKIAGRQFDVTVRFNDGLYDYLTVVECKNYSNPVPVEKVDALATKSRDVRANKAVMVSASGFQSGCRGVAERHGIGLFTLTEVSGIPPEILGSSFVPTTVENIYDVALELGEPPQTRFIPLPQEGNRLPYLLKKSTVESSDTRRSLEVTVFWYLKTWRVKFEHKEQTHRISFQPGFFVTVPGVVPRSPVLAITIKYRLRSAYLATGEGLDPYVLTRLNTAFRYEDVLRGTSRQVAGSLNIGFDTMMKPGSFYANYMGFHYYCDRVEGDQMWLCLVESYQHGALWQTGEFPQKLESAQRYVEVTDRKEVERLRGLLSKLKR